MGPMNTSAQPSSPRYSVGDRVFLKSGGPIMTVLEYTPDGRVKAAWWLASKSEYKSGAFPEGALCLFAPESKHVTHMRLRDVYGPEDAEQLAKQAEALYGLHQRIAKDRWHNGQSPNGH